MNSIKKSFFSVTTVNLELFELYNVNADTAIIPERWNDGGNFFRWN